MDSQSIVEQNPKIKLNNGQLIPQVGLGVYKVAGESAEPLIIEAFEAGYRRIDTAAFYGNEPEVGAAVRNSGLAREEIFVTTKIWKDDHGYDRALAAIDESLDRLDIEYIDMLLIHWPSPALNKFIDTWAAFQKAQELGKIRSIGVSNFQPAHLEQLLAAGDTVPAINQIELHPGLQQADVRGFNSAHGILTEAWSPLARGRFNDSEVITQIMSKHNRSATQVIVRWHVQLGNLVIPKTATASRLQGNISVFDFKLDDEDMAAIATLDSGLRTGPHPEEF
jgi:diketogulonate reductase-like aldo/keto reductase